MSIQANTESAKKVNVIPAEEEVALKLPKWKMWYIMAIIYILYALDYAARMVITPLFPYLQKDLGLTDPQLGMLSSVVLGGVCIFSMPLAAIIDRWKRGKAIGIMSVIWSLATIGTGISQGFSQIIASRAIVGVGEASFSSGGAAMISAMFPRTKRATVIGFWNTSITVGIAAGLMTGGAIAAYWGWRTAFYVVAIPGIIAGILAWFMPDYKNIDKDKAQSKFEYGFIGTIKSVVTVKSMVCLFLAGGITSFLIQAATYWSPTYMVRMMNMTPAEAGTIGGLLTVLASFGYPLGGWICDRWAKKDLRARMFMCAVTFFAYVVVVGAGAMLLSIPLFAIAGVLSCMFPASLNVITQEVVPSYQRATAFGAYVLSMYIFGGLWGPIATGYLSAAYGLQMALYIVGAISLLAIVFFLLGAKFYTADFYRARQLEKEAGL